MSVAYTSRRPRSITAALFTEWRTKLALAIVPVDLRASVAGDLFEQLETRVIPERGIEGGRRWLYAEIARSAPAMIRHRVFGGPADLLRRRWWSAGLVLVLHGVMLCGLDYARATPFQILAIAVAMLVPWSALLLGATKGTVILTSSPASMLCIATFRLLEAQPDVWASWYFITQFLLLAGTPGGSSSRRSPGPLRAAK